MAFPWCDIECDFFTRVMLAAKVTSASRRPRHNESSRFSVAYVLVDCSFFASSRSPFATSTTYPTFHFERIIRAVPISPTLNLPISTTLNIARKGTPCWKLRFLHFRFVGGRRPPRTFKLRTRTHLDTIYTFQSIVMVPVQNCGFRFSRGSPTPTLPDSLRTHDLTST